MRWDSTGEHSWEPSESFKRDDAMFNAFKRDAADTFAAIAVDETTSHRHKVTQRVLQVRQQYPDLYNALENLGYDSNFSEDDDEKIKDADSATGEEEGDATGEDEEEEGDAAGEDDEAEGDAAGEEEEQEGDAAGEEEDEEEGDAADEEEE